jgi:hypothetical protein
MLADVARIIILHVAPKNIKAPASKAINKRDSTRTQLGKRRNTTTAKVVPAVSRGRRFQSGARSLVFGMSVGVGSKPAMAAYYCCPLKIIFAKGH